MTTPSSKIHPLPLLMLGMLLGKKKASNEILKEYRVVGFLLELGLGKKKVMRNFYFSQHKESCSKHRVHIGYSKFSCRPIQKEKLHMACLVFIYHFFCRPAGIVHTNQRVPIPVRLWKTSWFRSS